MSMKWMRLAAWAVLLAGALGVAHAQCKYKKIGSIPYEWVGSRMMIAGSINGKPLKMVVDTGAVWTTMSRKLVESMNLPVEHAYGEMAGFGGRSEISLVSLDELSIGRFEWHRTKAVVAWDTSKGMEDVLVSGNVLLQRDVEMDGQQINIFSPSGCDDAALGYWADDVPWVSTGMANDQDMRVTITMQVNGQPVQALIDTGAPTTIVDDGVARRLGFDPDDPASRIGDAGGIGVHRAAVSVATFDTIAIGPEVIHHARVRVADLWKGVRDDYHRNSTAAYVDEQPHLILGADFVRSHHLLFAGSQRRLYFSYLGGDVFIAPKPRPATAASGAAPAGSAPAAGG